MEGETPEKDPEDLRDKEIPFGAPKEHGGAWFDWIHQQIEQTDAKKPWDQRPVNKYNDTPLMVAAARGDPRAVRCLLAGGADPSFGKSSTGTTALHYALAKLDDPDRQEGYTAVVRSLVVHGADPDIAGKHPNFRWRPKDKLEKLALPGASPAKDAVVVLGGPNWESRISRGMDTWEWLDRQTKSRRGGLGAPLFVVSGLVTDRMVRYIVREGSGGTLLREHQERLVFDTQAHSTIQNAANLKRYLARVPGDIHLVTTRYHMAKACDIFKAAVPNAGRLIPVVSDYDPDPKWLVKLKVDEMTIEEQFAYYPQRHADASYNVNTTVREWEAGQPRGLGRQPAARKVAPSLDKLLALPAPGASEEEEEVSEEP